MRRVLSLFVILFATLCSFTQQTSEFVFTEVDANYFGKADYTIQYANEITENDLSGKPLFEIFDEGKKTIGKGWLGATPVNFYVKVEIEDKDHFNTYKDQNLWKGDAIQIGFDGRGDGTQTNSIDFGGSFGNDDIAISMAIGEKGPQAWIQFHGSSMTNENISGEQFSIKREGDNTTYFIGIPWSLLEIKAGLYPNVGIAIQVNDNEKEGDQQKRYYFGKGAGGRMNTGYFKKVRIENYPDILASFDLKNDVCWNNKYAIEYIASIKTNDPLKLKAMSGEVSKELEIPASEQLKRYRVTLVPKKDIKNNADIKLDITYQTTILAEISGKIIKPFDVYHAFVKKLNKLIETSEHELFTRHLKSVKAISTTEWARSEFILDNDRRHADETLGYIQKMLDGFNGAAGNWDNYKKGKISMIMMYISKRDRTQQFYTFSLPKNWDPEKAYPLYVELHGAGNQNPLNGPSVNLGLGGESLDLHGYESARSYAVELGNGYHVAPFGRGNTSYRDIGEIDVWEAFDDVHQHFKINEEKRYLYGFSMGGGGTAHLALRAPHLWAAIAIYAGSFREPATVGFGRNVSYLPIWMSCGQEDFLYNNMRQLEKEILAYGPQPDTTWIPNLGHKYTYESQKAGIEWLQQHTRKRPSEFEYVAVEPAHTGTWGIYMKWDQAVSGMPNFKCKISGNSVEITSEGTEQLIVNFGERGLGLEGEVTLTWNGKQVYKGSKQKVTVDKDGEIETPPRGRFSRKPLTKAILDKY